MRNILFLALILLSCSQNRSSESAIMDVISTNDSLSSVDTISEVNLSTLLDEQNEIFELIEQFKETGEAKRLQGVLDYWKSGLKQEYIETFTPLYCGLVSELMGEKTNAYTYYAHSKELALERISKPLDDIEFEYGVKSEEDLTKVFKLTDSDFDLEEFKSQKVITQKYWLYISQIALGENKFKEFNNIDLAAIELAFLSDDIDIKKREDIFQLITGRQD